MGAFPGDSGGVAPHGVPFVSADDLNNKIEVYR